MLNKSIRVIVIDLSPSARKALWIDELCNGDLYNQGWPKKRTVESSCRVGRLVLGLVGLVLLVLGLVVQTRVRHSSREREGGARQVGQAAQMNATLVILNFTASNEYHLKNHIWIKSQN